MNKLKWCTQCGEGVIDACRGSGENCGYGLPKIKRAKNSGLTTEQVWNSDTIMGLNAKFGLSMDDIMKFVRAVEHEQNNLS